MAVTILTQVYKHPSMSHREFVDYCENHHMPLLQQCYGDALPDIRRIYIDTSHYTLLGQPASADLVLESRFKDEAAWNRMLARWKEEPELAQKIEADEEVFCAPGKSRKNSVRVGEIRE